MTASSHIIIVNYNAGVWLSRAVGSALEHSNSQITVVDNKSSDNSIARARMQISDPRVDWQMNQQNVGFAAANNQVLRALDTDYAVLMNPDCELANGTLESILDAFAEFPKMAIASCRILNEDGGMQATCRRRFPTPWSALGRMLMLDRLFPNDPKFANFDYGIDVDKQGQVETVDAISGAFMVVRMAAIRQVGLLDESYFMHCEDLDWCKRFALEGWSVGFIPSASVIHAKGVSTQSRPIGVLWTLHKGMDRFFSKFYRKDYSWPVRASVKAGIYLSFAGRAILSVLKRCWSRS